METTSVLIGIPHRGDLIDARFDVPLLATIFNLAQAGVGVEVKKAWGRRETLDHVRNIIVRYFLETKHTHLFFLDDDILLLPHTVEKLLARDLPIVSGLYYERMQSHRPILINTPKNEAGEMRYEWLPLENAQSEDGSGLVRVDVVPGGCLLIKREVFEKLSPPWFLFKTEEHVRMGEDVYFSLHAGRNGYSCYVDISQEVLHVTSHVTGSAAALKEWEDTFGFKRDPITD